jgi:hypothetical protein
VADELTPRIAAGARPRLDARTTAWLLAQRARAHELELEAARLRGHLEASERIERASQRYADKLEERLGEARKREASLARALGYVEAQRDRLLGRSGSATPGLGTLAPFPRRAAVRPEPRAKR